MNIIWHKAAIVKKANHPHYRSKQKAIAQNRNYDISFYSNMHYFLSFVRMP